MITPTFDKTIENAVVDGIGQQTIHEGFISFMRWNNKNARILSFLIKEGVITKEKVLGAIHALLIKTGRACYGQHLAGTYPDHTSSPQALAYTLKHNAFTQKEEQRIKFDHGETKSSFIELYEGNIQLSIYNQLTTEREAPEKILAGVTDKCLDCNH